MRKTNMNFDKFMKDIEKREEAYNKEKIVMQRELDEVMAKRRRAELYQEKWQNRIVWEKKNEG